MTTPMLADAHAVAKLHGQNETGIPYDYENHPEHIFCGNFSAPHLTREDGKSTVFGCLWEDEVPPIGEGVQWVSIEKANTLLLVPHSRVIMQMAIDVLIHGKIPYFAEHLCDQ